MRALKVTMTEAGVKAPLFTSDGAWNENIILCDADDVKNYIKELLERTSLNSYMFHGETNFRFMNGACAGGFGSLP